MNAHQRRVARRAAVRRWIYPDPGLAVYKAMEKVPAIAERRAYELLRSHLDDEQIADLEANHGFNITAANGHRYRLHMMRQMLNNIVDEQGSVLGVWPRYITYTKTKTGAQVRHMLPMGDIVLGQKLGLECGWTCQYLLSMACVDYLSRVERYAMGPMRTP